MNSRAHLLYCTILTLDAQMYGRSGGCDCDCEGGGGGGGRAAKGQKHGQRAMNECEARRGEARR